MHTGSETRVLHALCFALAWTVQSASFAVGQNALHIYQTPGSGLTIDPNGFLLNPVWQNAGPDAPNIEDRCRFRAATGHLEERTLIVTRAGCLSTTERSLVTLTEAPTVLGLGLVCKTNSQIGTVRGHVNWFPMTATGQLYGMGYSGGPAMDQDITIDLITPSPNALTSGNRIHKEIGRPGYHIEFFVGETLARLGPGTSWWHAIARAAEDPSLRSTVVDGRIAKVTGLYGLDGVHGFHAELHPVYALSVLVDVRRNRGGQWEERWALMVRNRGNEGDCASGQFPMMVSDPREDRQSFVVDLGWWNGATGAQAAIAQAWMTSNGSAPTFRAIPGRHTYLQFEHPRPRPTERDYLFLGTVTITWQTNRDWGLTDRFDGWYPASDLPVNLAVVGQSGDRSLLRQLGGQIPSSAPGRTALEDRVAVNDTVLTERNFGRLAPIQAAWQPATGVRADAVIPWRYQPVTDGCRQHTHDPICRGGWRWALGGTFAITGDNQLRPLTYIFMGAHGWRGLGPVGDVLQAFAWRLEFRADQYEGNDTPAAPLTPREGFGLRLGPLLASSNLRIGSAEVFTPYLTGGLGPFFSWSDFDQPRVSFALGAGVHFQTGYHEFFAEYQVTKTINGSDRQRTFLFGIILAKPLS